MTRLRVLQELLGSVFAGNLPVGFPGGAGQQGEHVERSFAALCDALLSSRGEVSGGLLARALLGRLAGATVDEEREFFELLAQRFDVNATQCAGAARHYAQAPTADNLERLVQSVEPRRQELLRRLNQASGGTAALVRLRERLFEHMSEAAPLQRIDVDFRHLFRSWFNRGFLVLREIDWNSSATVLEKIIAYEAVHAISSWEALRERLQPEDRRCFAFFHPAMPDEPLIFVEVALTREAPGSIREVLAETRESVPAIEADTAVFYSISNCQRGLAGVSFGSFLIKQVAAELQASLPNLKTFRTLSPVPGFMRWVGAQPDPPAPPLRSGLAVAHACAAGGSPSDDAERVALASAVAYYLADATRADGQPQDPVARFHLGNGASLDRVLPQADLYDTGRQASAGAMVSYLYDLTAIEANHERYASRREVIVSAQVQALLDPHRTRKPTR